MSTVNLSTLLSNTYQGATGFTGSAGQAGAAAPRSITIEGPTNSEKIIMFYTNVAIDITEIRSVLIGSNTPSVTFNIRYGSNSSATGTAVATSGITTTNTTTGLSTTSFDNSVITAESFVWITTTAVSGTVNYLHVSIR